MRQFCHGMLLCFSVLLATQVAFGQNVDFQFKSKIGQGKFYLLKGTIDGKYNITMKLDVLNAARCGEEWKAIQWKNGGIDGWYEYDRIGKRIPLTGSFLNGHEVKLYVPNSAQDTIDKFTCEMKNFKEIFWNSEDFDVTKMKWKRQKDLDSIEVELVALHKPVEDTMFLELVINDEMVKVIDVSDLTEVDGLDIIEIISYSKVGSDYHLLFKLENFGWREYQDYIGYIAIGEDLQIKNFNVLLRSDSWNGEIVELIYHEAHPENGVKRL